MTTNSVEKLIWGQTQKRFYNTTITISHLDITQTDEQIAEFIQEQANTWAESLVTKAEKKADRYYAIALLDRIVIDRETPYPMATADVKITISIE